MFYLEASVFICMYLSCICLYRSLSLCICICDGCVGHSTVIAGRFRVDSRRNTMPVPQRSIGLSSRSLQPTQQVHLEQVMRMGTGCWSGQPTLHSKQTYQDAAYGKYGCQTHSPWRRNEQGLYSAWGWSSAHGIHLQHSVLV